MSTFNNGEGGGAPDGTAFGHGEHNAEGGGAPEDRLDSALGFVVVEPTPSPPSTPSPPPRPTGLELLHLYGHAHSPHSPFSPNYRGEQVPPPPPVVAPPAVVVVHKFQHVSNHWIVPRLMEFGLQGTGQSFEDPIKRVVRFQGKAWHGSWSFSANKILLWVYWHHSGVEERIDWYKDVYYLIDDTDSYLRLTGQWFEVLTPVTQDETGQGRQSPLARAVM